MTTADERPRLRWGMRFSPHVIPFLATIGLAWIPFSSAIVSGVFWWYGPTYQNVEFVMDEAERNPSCFQRGWTKLPVLVGELV